MKGKTFFVLAAVFLSLTVITLILSVLSTGEQSPVRMVLPWLFFVGFWISLFAFILDRSPGYSLSRAQIYKRGAMIWLGSLSVSLLVIWIVRKTIAPDASGTGLVFGIVFPLFFVPLYRFFIGKHYNRT